MHTTLLLHLSRFYCVQDAKSTHGNSTGRVINHYVLMMGRRYKVVLSEVQMPDLCCCGVVVGMLRLGLAGAVVLAWPTGSAGLLQLGPHGDGDTRTARPCHCSGSLSPAMQVKDSCLLIRYRATLWKPFPFRLKITSDGECEFPSKFAWLQHAASSGAYSAFGSQLE